MYFYLWDDRLSIGLEQIDKDHKKMVFYVNEIHYALTKVSGKNKNKLMLQNLDALVLHSREHFRREELEMDRREYSGLEAHRCEHRVLMTEIEKIQARFADEKHFMTMLDVKILKDWVNSHIVTSDRQMAEEVFETKRREEFERTSRQQAGRAHGLKT